MPGAKFSIPSKPLSLGRGVDAQGRRVAHVSEAGTVSAQVQPNRYRPPGPIGNVNGLIVPDTAPNPTANPAPPIKPTEKEKGWWDRWGSAVTHGVLDVVGLIPVVGEIADGANALIYVAEGDYVNAAISAAAMVPGAGMAATGAKYGKKVVGAVAEGAAKKAEREAAERAATAAAKKKAQQEAAEAAAKKKKGGKDKGNPRCVLRPYKPDTCKPRTGHHVVPDRAFQIGGRKTGTRIPGPNGGAAMTEAEGLVICVDGATPKPSNEHGQVHAAYDAAEKVLGAAGNPPGTASLLSLELAGAAAAAAVTKCNAAALAAQLRAYNQAKGLGHDFVVRADKQGRLASKAPFSTFGSTTSQAHGGF
jgi:hypothetical protein